MLLDLEILTVSLHNYRNGVAKSGLIAPQRRLATDLL
jgi:hypothetical protein